MKPEARLEVANNSRCQAESYLNKNNPGRAFAHFLVALKLCPNWKQDLKITFSSTLCSWGTELESQKRYKDLFHCYEQALEVFPDCEEILNNLGAHLYRLGHVREASHYFRKALMIEPDFLPARRNLQTVSNLVVERWHFRMLNDRLRNEAFREAIFKKVQQNFDNVLDIGTGTGILSMFAAKAGAQNVYSCEVSSTMYQIANDVIKANNFMRKIHVMNKSSYDLQIPSDMPERASLVVTETMDCGLLGEHVLTILSDAWKRLLLPPCEGLLSIRKIHKSSSPVRNAGKAEESEHEGTPPLSEDSSSLMQGRYFWRYAPGGSMVGHGIVIPFGASVCVAAIECHSLSLRYHLHHTALVKQHLEFPAAVIANCTGNGGVGDFYDAEDLHQLPGGFRYLVNATEVLYVNFNDPEEIEARLSGSCPPEVLRVPVSTSGRFDAVAAWFMLDVDEDIKLATAPGKGSCWEQAVFPLYPPVVVAEGETVEFAVTSSGKKLSICAKVIENTDSSEAACNMAEPVSDSISKSNFNPHLEELCPTESIGSVHLGSLGAKITPLSKTSSADTNPSEMAEVDSELSRLVENLATSTISSLPLTEKFFLPETSVALLNNNKWIEGIINAAERVALNGKIETVLDISPFPIFGLKMLKMRAAERLVWCTFSNGPHEDEDEKLFRQLAALNGIEAHHLIFQPEEALQGDFDVIYVDLVDATGELSEETIGKLPSIMQMLKPEGILIPEKITVTAQLLFSKWLARMSHILSDENVCSYKIAEFINVYKVPQHLDVDLNALSNDVCNDPIQILQLDVRSLAQGKTAKDFKIAEMSVPQKCTVNAIVHWYDIMMLDDVQVSSFGVDSHCRQVATLLPSELEVTSEDKVLVKITHYQGLLYLQFIECVPLHEQDEVERSINE